MDVEVRWRPFFLDPSAPIEGVVKLDMYHAKFGEARVKQMLPMMVKVGEAEGIAFSYGGKTGATMSSHRLAQWAFNRGGTAMQGRLMEEMFKDYFEREQFLGDAGVLARAAVRAGVCVREEEAVSFLNTDALRAEVEADVKAFAAKFRISGVPFFVIDGKYSISGAQEAEAFVEVFQEIVGQA